MPLNPPSVTALREIAARYLLDLSDDELEVYRGTKKMTIDVELGRQPTSPQ